MHGQLPDGTPLAIPFTTITGAQPGPRLVVTAGVHGDEFEGVRAVADLCYPLDYRFQPCPVAHIVEDTMPFVIGTMTITPLTTPGHVAGHIAYMLHDGERRCLFIGDLLLCNGRVLLQATYDCQPQQLAQSLLRLADQQIDALLPGHMDVCLREGQAHIDAANRYTANGLSNDHRPPGASISVPCVCPLSSWCRPVRAR